MNGFSNAFFSGVTSLELCQIIYKYFLKNRNLYNKIINVGGHTISPAARIEDIAKALLKIFNKKNKIKIIGPRHGEKLHESLCTTEEMSKAINQKKYFRIPADLRNINYDIHNQKNDLFKSKKAYSSNNTKILNINELVSLLKRQREIIN